MNVRSLSEIISETCGIALENLNEDTRIGDSGLTSLDSISVRRRIEQDFGVRLPFVAFSPQHSIGEVVTRIEEALCELPDGATSAGDTGGRQRGRSTSGPRPGAADEAPLTAVQAAYWAGRDPELPLGGVATYWYHEYESTPDRPGHFLDALENAWRTLIDVHPMLRMRVTAAGRQQIIPESDWSLQRIDLRSEPSHHDLAIRLRTEADHRNLTEAGGPPFFVRAVLLPGSVRVQVGFDAIAVDLRSWRLLMHQWGRLTADPGCRIPAPQFDFCQQLAVEPPGQFGSDDPTRAADVAWVHRTPPLPLTEIPRDGHRFVSHEGVLDAAVWRRVREHAGERGLTPTGVVLTAFATALALHAGPGSLALTVDGRGEYETRATVVGDFARLVAMEPPLRRWSRGETAADYARRVADALGSAVDTGESAIEVGRRQRAWDGAMEGVPALPVVFTSALGDDGATDDEWLGECVHRVSQTPQVLIDHIVREEDGRLLLCLDAVDEALEPGFAAALCRSTVGLLNGLADPDGWLDPAWGGDPTGDLPLPRVPSPFSGAGSRIDDPLRMVEERQAPAVLAGGAALSHGAAARGAAAVAEELVRRGIEPGRPVVIAIPKSTAQVVAVLGVMRSGAWYVPVDPGWPLRRLEEVRRRSGASMALVLAGSEGEAISDLFDVMELDDEGRPNQVRSPGARRCGDETGADRHPLAEHRAYAIFTSGSTGEPKGVAITHDQARTTIDAVVDRFRFGPDDRVLGVSALTFDLSVFDVFGMLGAGGALVLPDETQLRDPSAWCDLIEEHAVTVWNSAPPLLEMLVEYAEHDDRASAQLCSLRTVMLSGDWIPVTLPDRFRALVPHADVHSLGGATEAAIWSIAHAVGEVDPSAPSIPYGRALPGQSFFVLTDDGAPAAVGNEGELFIGGEGVAEGYLDDPEQTDERFVELPAVGRRVYRTGDRGRWLRSGDIEFRGRVDRQVKINGFRIELGEIDAALTRVTGVRGAVAAAVDGPDGRLRLVAWVGGDGLDADRVRSEAADRLPAYMVPSVLTILRSLPVTDNGKIDHRALPDPFARAKPADSVSDAGNRAASASTPHTDAVRRVVTELMGRAPDSARSLLEQGGTSLDAVRIANVVEERWGHRPSVRSLLSDRPLAEVLAGAGAPEAESEAVGAGDSDSRMEDTRAPAPAFTGAAAGPSAPALPHASPLPLPPLAGELRIERPAAPSADHLRELADWADALGGLGEQLRWGTDCLLILPLGGDTVAHERPSPGAVATKAGAGSPAAARPDRGRHGSDQVAIGSDRVRSAQDHDEVGSSLDGPFELTEMQMAYLLGRRDDAVGVRFAPHYYTEVRVAALDPHRLRAALEAVSAAHPMLRARITHDARQIVLPVEDPDARIPLRVHDHSAGSRKAAEAAVSAVRELRSHEVIDPVSDPSLSFDVIAFPDGSWVVGLSMDLLFVDAASAVTIVEALDDAVAGDEVRAPQADFRGWATAVSQRRLREGREPQLAHWRARLEEMPSPALTGPVTGGESAAGPVVVRHEERVHGALWSRIVRTAGSNGVSPTAVVLTALAGALGAEDGKSGTSIILTLFDRPADHRGVIGDYTSTLVVGLPASVGTFAERARRMRDRLAEDLEHSVGPLGVHGNEVLRMWARSGGPQRVPIVFSSGLGSVSATSGRPVDAGRLLDSWGTTEYAISQTPGVLADVQVFEDTDGLVVRIDAVDSLLPPRWAATVLAEVERTVRGLAGAGGWTETAGGTLDIGGGTPTSVVERSTASRSPGLKDHAEGTTGLRNRLRDLLAETIGRNAAELDPDARFFALGVDSIGLIRFQRRLAEEGMSVDVLDLFEASTLTALAEHLDADSDPTAVERPALTTEIGVDTDEPRSRRERRRAARQLSVGV